MQSEKCKMQNEFPGHPWPDDSIFHFSLFILHLPSSVLQRGLRPANKAGAGDAVHHRTLVTLSLAGI
jgi:hypothetical protein